MSDLLIRDAFYGLSFSDCDYRKLHHFRSGLHTSASDADGGKTEGKTQSTGKKVEPR